MCIAGNDFGNCYDRKAHPDAAISLWSWGVPQPVINVLLKTMETIRFFLHAGFKELKALYGGHMKSALQGTDKEMLPQALASLH